MGKQKHQIIDRDQRNLKELIPRKADIIERIKRGDVCDVVIDSETTTLSRHFAQPTMLGAVVANPFFRQVVRLHERKVQIPEDAVMGFIPAMITNRHPDTFEKGMRPDLAVAELYDLIMEAPKAVAHSMMGFRDQVIAYNKGKAQADQIPVPPESEPIEYVYESNKRTKAERDARIKTPGRTRTSKNEAIYIPSVDEHGQIVYDFAISHGGKRVYWREGEDWHRVDAKKTTVMHNARADNNWLWEWLHKYQLPEQFITHTKRNRAYQIDTVPLAREVALLGPQGRHKLHLGVRKSREHGDVPSASKELLLDANTRLANNRLHLMPGIQLPDFSHGDKRRGHISPLYDCLEELGIYWYCERLAPDLVAHKKHLSDHDVAKRLLSGADTNGIPPVISFVRMRYPHISAHMGVILNVDKAYGDFKRGVAVALDVLHADANDPSRLLLPDGRNLFDLAEDDILTMMRQGDSDPNAVFEIFRLNKGPMIQTAETGMKAGANHDVPYQELKARRDLIVSDSMRGFRNRMMSAYGQYVRKIDTAETVPDARPEEYVFNTLGDPLRVQIPRGNADERRAMENAIFERARIMRSFYNDRNRILRLVLRPHPGLETDPPKKSAFEDFTDVLEEAATKLAKTYRNAGILGKVPENPKIKLPRRTFSSNHQALDFLWDLRKTALKEGWLVDVSPHYWVKDRKTGREISQSRLQLMEYAEFDRKFDPENEDGWDVEYERLNYSSHFLAMMFALAGREDALQELDKGWEDWLKAQRAFGIHGSPMLDPSRQRLPTAESELLFVEAAKRNAPDIKMMRDFPGDTDIALGIFERFVANVPGRQQMMADLEAYYRALAEKAAWKPKKLAIAGYDPVTKMPLDNIIHPIARADFKDPDRTVIIDVPDLAPYEPLHDPRLGQMLYPVPLSPELEKAYIKGKLGAAANIVFKGARTGKHFLAPSATFNVVALNDPSVDHLTGHIRRIFENSAAPYSEERPVLLISCEGAEPLASTRPVKPLFELQVSGPHRFTALLAPEIAGFKALGKGQVLTGLAVPDYHYTKKRGAKIEKGGRIRLRETDEKGQETGWEVEVELLKKPKYLTLQEFEEKFKAGEITDDNARNFGFADAKHMYQEVVSWFTDLQKPKADHENRILLLREFKLTAGAVYFNPAALPRAAVMETYARSKREISRTLGSWGPYGIE